MLPTAIPPSKIFKLLRGFEIFFEKPRFFWIGHQNLWKMLRELRKDGIKKRCPCLLWTNYEPMRPIICVIGKCTIDLIKNIN